MPPMPPPPKPDPIDQLADLARDQTKRLIALEEGIGHLRSDGVLHEDRFILVTFLEAASEFIRGARDSFQVAETHLFVTAGESNSASDKNSRIAVNELENLKAGLDRMASALKKAREGGGSAKAIRSAMVDVRRTLSFIEL